MKKLYLLLTLFAPAISFAQWTTSGVNVFHNTTGIVGIGTSTATTFTNAKLNVYKSGNGTSVLIGNPNIASGSYTSLRLGTSADLNGYSFINSIKGAAATPVYGDLVLNQAGGNVGIGKVPASNYKLDVAGTINATSILVGGQPIPTGTSLQWTTTGSDIVYNAGRVGIGTTALTEKLTVQGNIQIPLATSIGYLQSTDKFVHNGNTIGNYSIGWANDSWLDGAPTSYYSGYGGIKFFTNVTPRLVIDYLGNVGIGTTSANARLQVESGSDASNALRLQSGGFSMNGTAPFSIDANGVSSGRFVVLGNGNVGIGATSPSAKLQVLSSTPIGADLNSEVLITRFSTNVANQQSLDLKLIKYSTTDNAWWGNGLRLQRNIDDAVNSCYIDFGASETNAGAGSNELGFGVGNTEYMRISSSGSVGIGTTTLGSYKLAVAGKIAATGEVKVFVDGTTTFPDYVFDPSYKLPTLEETEKYVKENHHLPEVPSAKEMEKDGIGLTEMNIVLLKKVEELTLYMIEMKKKTESLEKEIKELKENQKK